MKHRFWKAISLFCFVIMLLCFMTACDSSGGKTDVIVLQSYRNDGSFELPINANRHERAPSDSRAFSSKSSLNEIHDSLQEKTTYELVLKDDSILIKDTSENELGYCLLKTLQGHPKYNYVVMNMSYSLYPQEGESFDGMGYIMLPTYLMEELPSDLRIKNNSEHLCNGTIDEFIAFYETSRFVVTRADDELIIKETIGRKQLPDSEYSMEEVASEFKLSFHNEKVKIQTA